jgi:hypothetical protein
MEVTVKYLEEIDKKKYVFKVPYKDEIINGIFYGFRENGTRLRFWNLDKEDHKGTQFFITYPVDEIDKLELIGSEGSLEVRLLHYPQNDDGSIKTDKSCPWDMLSNSYLNQIDELFKTNKNNVNKDKIQKLEEEFKKSEDYKYFEELEKQIPVSKFIPVIDDNSIDCEDCQDSLE